MNKPSVQHLIIVCSILLLLLILISTVILINDKKFDNFYLNLYSIDNNLNSGFHIQAAEDLQLLYNNIYNSKTALMFLKRYFKIAESAGDYHSFADLSGELHNRFKTNIEIAAVYAYALRKNNNNQKSLDISEKKLKKTIYDDIHLLNIIEAGLSDDTYGFIFTETYTPEILESYASANYDVRYIIDEALLLLSKGDLNEAESLLAETDDALFPEIKMFCSYDNGNFSDAEKYFNFIRQSEPQLEDQTLFMGCDIFMRNGNYQEASNLYLSYIDGNADKYSLPYRNLYSMYRDDFRANSWLAEGIGLFPDSNELLIPYAWESYLNNDYKEFNTTMSQFQDNKVDSTVELLKINILLIGRSPEHIIGNYWNIFNVNPESQVIAKAFAVFLLENRQFEQLEIMLKRYLNNNKPEDWMFVYSAIGKALSGEFNDALNEIETAIILNENTVTTFNKAVILQLAGSMDEAKKFFKKALVLEDQNKDNFKVLSKIYFKLAETNYNIKEYEAAYHSVIKAIDLNHDNMKSSLLLKKIEEEYND